MLGHESPGATTSEPVGAYGFRRRELVALVSLAIIIGGITLVRWWQRDQALTHRQWTASDIYIDSLLVARSVQQRTVDDSPEAERTRPSVTTVDINTADERELMRIPGIGPALAQRILVSRATEGPFASLNDLQRVHGIGTKTVARIAKWVRFSTAERITTDTVEVSP